jgi:hypothetical protein
MCDLERVCLPHGFLTFCREISDFLSEQGLGFQCQRAQRDKRSMLPESVVAAGEDGERVEWSHVADQIRSAAEQP